MIVIIAVGATAFLSNRNSFHKPTFFEMSKPIAPSITPCKIPYWTAPLSANISMVIPSSCNCCSISCEYISGMYNPVQYPPINPLHKTKNRNFQLLFYMLFHVNLLLDPAHSQSRSDLLYRNELLIQFWTRRSHLTHFPAHSASKRSMSREQ